MTLNRIYTFLNTCLTANDVLKKIIEKETVVLESDSDSLIEPEYIVPEITVIENKQQHEIVEENSNVDEITIDEVKLEAAPKSGWCLN